MRTKVFNLWNDMNQLTGTFPFQIQINKSSIHSKRGVFMSEFYFYSQEWLKHNGGLKPRPKYM